MEISCAPPNHDTSTFFEPDLCEILVVFLDQFKSAAVAANQRGLLKQPSCAQKRGKRWKRLGGKQAQYVLKCAMKMRSMSQQTLEANLAERSLGI